MGHETLHGTVPAQMGMLDSTVLHTAHTVPGRQKVGKMQIFYFALCLCL